MSFRDHLIHATPWHTLRCPVPVDGKLTQRCREDIISRGVWEDNVVKGDRKREIEYRRRRIRKIFHWYSPEEVEALLKVEMAQLR